MLPLTPHSQILELALRIGLRSVAYHATALPLSYASVEALIGFEPMTCSFGRSRAGPLRYRAEIVRNNFGVTDGSRTR